MLTMAEYFLRIDPFDMFPHVIAAERDQDGSLLDMFYREIGCDTIDIVRTRWLFLDDQILFVCDDNALINGLQKFNAIATMLYCSRSQIFGSVIVGLSGTYDGEPDIVGFRSETDAEFTAMMIRKRIVGVDDDPYEYGVRD